MKLAHLGIVAAAVTLYATAPFSGGQSVAAPAAQEPSLTTPAPSLDFEFFKTRVEPIFLEKRPGHARCYVCHAPSGIGYRSALKLQALSPGSATWTEEQSRRNFEVVSRLVVPGDPTGSRLLIHPLVEPPGPRVDIHSGGEQFASQNDPDWQTLADWVRGQKASSPPGK